MTRCKFCGEEVTWITACSGDRILCNPNIVMYWANLRGKAKVVTQDGEVVCADLDGDLGKSTGVGYVQYFSTCPYGRRNRNNKNTRRINHESH